MIRILFAGREMASIPAFKSALDKRGVHTTYVDSGRKALSVISEEVFDLLIADEDLGDMTGFELIKSVVTQNPMLNCTAISSLSSDEFHEASEGLGILMQLPIKPDKNEIDQLLEQLKKIQSFTNKSVPREN